MLAFYTLTVQQGCIQSDDTRNVENPTLPCTLDFPRRVKRVVREGVAEKPCDLKGVSYLTLWDRKMVRCMKLLEYGMYLDDS